ncbi:MAG: biopolymer transporter ExbB [Zetaproteobacteria bacterium]|nr:biopolymer transporter ExbB [Pseudobdellovibrionaceae bacterium]|tara:strand:+ start:116 stop:640 length:525 start_codon:yes stop_codon:yes gene_type:complete
MGFVLEFWETIRDFLESGGEVLLLIMATTFILWTLILERYWYFRKVYPAEKAAIISKWMSRSDRTSWNAHRIRESMISDASIKLKHSIGFIKTLVAVCPLLGLMGTVTGMISVFDVMAVTGTGNARLMASGITLATVPTMAGMVASLSGLYFGARLEKLSLYAKDQLSENLPAN